MIRYVYDAKSSQIHGRYGDWRVTINDNSPVLVECNDATQAVYTAMKVLTPKQRSEVTKVTIESVQ